MKIGRRRRARITCLMALYLYDVGKIPPDEIINNYVKYLENQGILNDNSVREFYENLFKTTVEHIKEIDSIIQSATKKWEFSRIFAIDKAILRMATAEMIFLKNQVPIVIDEAVEISKMYSPEEEKGPDFINGVLDTIAKTNITSL